jgi:hypothetical protein
MRFISAATLAAPVLVALAAAGSASADPRLDEVVYSPYVESHVLEQETRFGTELGHRDLGGANTVFLEQEWGVNDRLSVALVEQFEREPHGTERMTAAGVEARYYLGQIPRLGVDVGVYGEFKHGVGGEADGGEAKLLLAKTQGRFQGLVNLIVEEPFGAPRGEGYAAYGYAASATWRVAGPLRLGAEAFGDFGDDHHLGGRQGAYAGPQVKAQGRPHGWPVELSIDAGWLAAVGPARQEAPSQVRVQFEVERRF